MAKEEIRKRGPVTDYRPEDGEVLGGKDKSVQSEAIGGEGSDDLANDGTTSGGAAGRINDPTRRPKTTRGENDGHRGLPR